MTQPVTLEQIIRIGSPSIRQLLHILIPLRNRYPESSPVELHDDNTFTCFRMFTEPSHGCDKIPRFSTEDSVRIVLDMDFVRRLP